MDNIIEVKEQGEGKAVDDDCGGREAEYPDELLPQALVVQIAHRGWRGSFLDCLGVGRLNRRGHGAPMCCFLVLDQSVDRHCDYA